MYSVLNEFRIYDYYIIIKESEEIFLFEDVY
jgi:hypothetical protein